MKKYKATFISAVIAVLCVLGHITLPNIIAGNSSLYTFIGDIRLFYACLALSGLILGFGIYCDIKLHNKSKAASEVHTTMLFATHHVLNNFLNGMELVRMEANSSQDFDKTIIQLYEESYLEAMNKIDRVSKIEDPTEEKIWDALIPGMKPPSNNAV